MQYYTINQKITRSGISILVE